MAYLTNIFSPETYAGFVQTDRTVTGFRVRQRNVAAVSKGDKLLCYVTRMSVWVGLLEVRDGPFQSDLPIFVQSADPFVIRFRVAPIVCLPLERGIRIDEPEMWNRLSFTQNRHPSSTSWTGKIRGSLVRLSDDDGNHIESALRTR